MYLLYIFSVSEHSHSPHINIARVTSDCNRIFKWVSTDRFWGPDHRLYLQLFDMTPLNLVIPIKQNFIAL